MNNDLHQIAMTLHQNPHLIDHLEQNHPELANHLAQQLQGPNSAPNPVSAPKEHPAQTMMTSLVSKWGVTDAAKQMMRDLSTMDTRPASNPLTIASPTATAGIRG